MTLETILKAYFTEDWISRALYQRLWAMFWALAARLSLRAELFRCSPVVSPGTWDCPLHTFRTSVCPLHTCRTRDCPRYVSSPSKVRGMRAFRISVCPLHTSRSQDSQLLQQWDLTVSPFTSVRAQLACSISISPADPHTCPGADRAFITVRGDGEVQQQPGLDHCHIQYDEEKRELVITSGKSSSGLSVDMLAPIKSSLYIATEGQGHVHISKMECDICVVRTEQGDCTLHSLKSHQIEVQSSGGQVTGLGTVHGNVDIVARGQSSVDVKKLQGTTVNVSTEQGLLKVKAIYAESSSISSCTGKIALGNIHGDASVRNVSGHTVIDGSNGFMKVSSSSGNIDLYVGDGASADIISEQGDVCVRVPSSFRAGVELCGATVDIGPELVFEETEKHLDEGQTSLTGFVNGESVHQRRLKAKAEQGSVRLKTQSWFESLRLKS